VPPDEPPIDDGPDLPADLWAERAALGAILTGSVDAYLAVTETVRPGDWYDPRHEAVAAALSDAFACGEIPDPVSVWPHIVKAGAVRQVGHPAYLSELLSACPTPAGAATYAKRVKAAAFDRRLIAAGTRLQVLGRSALDPDEKSGQAVAAVAEATEDGAPTTARPAGEAVADLADRLAEPADNSGVLWHTRDLNRDLLPMRPGQLWVIGARPGVGKSTLLFDTVWHAAVHQKVPTLLASAEMAEDEIAENLIAGAGPILKKNITNHDLTQVEWDRVWKAHADLADAPLVIDDNPHLTLDTLDRALRRGYQGGQYRLVAIDYLQLMSRRPGERPESRQVEVATLSRGLKLLAKKHRVTVLAAAQLNRALESRADKKPGMADLRESGGIEADADGILLLHREDMLDPDHPRSGEIDVIAAKQRRGTTGTITLAAQMHYGRLRDMA